MALDWVFELNCKINKMGFEGDVFFLICILFTRRIIELTFLYCNGLFMYNEKQKYIQIGMGTLHNYSHKQ